VSAYTASPFVNGKSCTTPGCRGRAGATGLCVTCHHRAMTDRTTDGVQLGGKKKLTPEQVAEARAMRAAFKSQTEIARHFGVSRRTLSNYLAGEAS